MNRKELVQAVADKSGKPQGDVDDVLHALSDVVIERVVADDTVTIQGFVKFEQTQRQARTGRNPQTGAEVQIPAQSAVKVSALQAFKKAVKGS